MDYQQAAIQFITDATNYLNDLRSQLISAGANPNALVVSEPDTNDLTVQLSATRGARNATLFFELTPVRPSDTTMEVFITLKLVANGSVVATTFTPSAPELYTSSAGLDRMLAKIVDSFGLKPELLTKLRAALGL